MLTTRKDFLRQAGFAVAGSMIPFSKLFASPNLDKKLPSLDNYHPQDCTIDLTSYYQYTYSNNNVNSQIALVDGYYSKPNPLDNTVNPLDNDVMYALEGQPPDDDTCDPLINACRNTDFDPYNPLNPGLNPFRYKVYYPKPDLHNYTETPLPCIVFFHAGGFQECPTYTLPIIKKLCIELSRKGYICFTVEYRRGRIKDPDLSKTSVQQELASYRAIQDGCGAIRSIIKKNRTAGEFDFKINEDQFFVGGTSAGGIIAMGSSYYRTSVDLVSSQTQIDSVYPKFSTSTYTIKEVLGNMHSDYYYAEPDPQYWPIIKGVVCMWSGILIPKIYDGGIDKGVTEKGFFPNSSIWANPPMIAFHGDDDTVIPYYDDNGQNIDLSAPPVIPSSQDYNSESYCTNNKTYQQDYSDAITLKMCSSLNMYYILARRNRFTELYSDCDMAHGLDSDCGGCTGDELNLTKDKKCQPCVFDSDFGTGYPNSDLVIQYMAKRIAVFFQTIMAYTTTAPLAFGIRGRSYFRECVNNRKCDQMTDNNACTGPDKNKLCNGSILSLD